jgi:hypothetical protein
MTRKIEAADVDFYFEDAVTQKDFDSVVRKVQNHINRNEYALSALFFTTNHNITAVIQYDVSQIRDKAWHKFIAAPLNRLIDSHKQAATYGWNMKFISKEVA